MKVLYSVFHSRSNEHWALFNVLNLLGSFRALIIVIEEICSFKVHYINCHRWIRLPISLLIDLISILPVGIQYSVKGKVVRAVHAMKACRTDRGIVPLILHLDARGR